MTVLVTFAYIQICPTYTGAKLMETTWHYRNWNLHNIFQTHSLKYSEMWSSLKADI